MCKCVNAMLKSEPRDVGICLLPVMANLDSDSSAVYSIRCAGFTQSVFRIFLIATLKYTYRFHN